MLAVGLTSLGSPILSRLLDEDNNHCTSGGAPLELWYWVSSSLCETPSLCRDSGTNRLAIWTESSHDFEMKYFFKNILFSAHKHPRASLVCSVPSP